MVEPTKLCRCFTVAQNPRATPNWPPCSQSGEEMDGWNNRERRCVALFDRRFDRNRFDSYQIVRHKDCSGLARAKRGQAARYFCDCYLLCAFVLWVGLCSSRRRCAWFLCLRRIARHGGSRPARVDQRPGHSQNRPDNIPSRRRFWWSSARAQPKLILSRSWQKTANESRQSRQKCPYTTKFPQQINRDDTAQRTRCILRHRTSCLCCPMVAFSHLQFNQSPTAVAGRIDDRHFLSRHCRPIHDSTNAWPECANSGLMRCRKSLKYPIGTGEHQTLGPCRS